MERVAIALRIAAGIITFFLLCVSAWNIYGRVQLPAVDRSFGIYISEGPLTGMRLNSNDALLLKDWIESRTRPSIDPIKILLHQLWYNAMTTGYDMKAWLASDVYEAGKEQYGVYIHDTVLFLRIEYGRRNRVLIAQFTSQELEDAFAASQDGKR